MRDYAGQPDRAQTSADPTVISCFIFSISLSLNKVGICQNSSSSATNDKILFRLRVRIMGLVEVNPSQSRAFCPLSIPDAFRKIGG